MITVDEKDKDGTLSGYGNQPLTLADMCRSQSRNRCFEKPRAPAKHCQRPHVEVPEIEKNKTEDFKPDQLHIMNQRVASVS